MALMFSAAYRHLLMVRTLINWKFSSPDQSRIDTKIAP